MSLWTLSSGKKGKRKKKCLRSRGDELFSVGDTTTDGDVTAASQCPAPWGGGGREETYKKARVEFSRREREHLIRYKNKFYALGTRCPAIDLKPLLGCVFTNSTESKGTRAKRQGTGTGIIKRDFTYMFKIFQPVSKLKPGFIVVTSRISNLNRDNFKIG